VTNDSEIKRFAVDIDRLPLHFPTHRHDAAFWEALGRAVATFGFLEEVLGKAIFALTATRKIAPDQIEAEHEGGFQRSNERSLIRLAALLMPTTAWRANIKMHLFVLTT
jgi:hypothetical protein